MQADEAKPTEIVLQGKDTSDLKLAFESMYKGIKSKDEEIKRLRQEVSAMKQVIDELTHKLEAFQNRCKA